MFHRRGGSLAIKVFIHVLIHSCVFRWVYVGQPYFQVSFNESQAYLGHFPLKLNIHQGIVSSPQYELLPALCAGSPRMFLCFNLLSGPPHHFVALFYSYGSQTLWTAFLGITHQCQDAASLLESSRLFGGLGIHACVGKRTPSNQCPLQTILTKHTWESRHTSALSWSATMQRVRSCYFLKLWAHGSLCWLDPRDHSSTVTWDEVPWEQQR